MYKIVECVPNFSEGKDKKKIALIVAEIKRVKGIKLLDVDPDADYNRVVVSFVGEPKIVKRAALAAILKACELIDMTSHKGEHPRLGACDVCPFVPIRNVTVQECVELARELGKEVSDRLQIPVYLYAEAAQKPERKNLATIREGEYEGLREKLRDPKWKPDFGPAQFVPKTGACVTGAREPLIAYNVNLKTKNKKTASRLAGIIRESGWLVVSRKGQKVRIPGVLKNVKAMGVYLKEYGLCQVSMNLTNYKVTPLHLVFETIKRIAPGMAEVSGSDIVGLVPKEAILMSGRFYKPAETSEENLIRAAVENLGLNSLKRFNSKKKIIEYLI